MRDILFFDTSSDAVLLAYYGKDSVFIYKNMPKKTLSSDLPLIIENSGVGKLISPETEIFIGAGPGSFTGIKTGVAFISAWLYAKGIRHIKTVSSLDIYSLFIPYQENSLGVVVTPFNSDEGFLSIFKWNFGKRLYIQQDNRLDQDGINKLFTKLNYDRAAIVITSDNRGPVDFSFFKKFFRELVGIRPGGSFMLDFAYSLPVIKKIDIALEPLMLNYVSAPADLNPDCEIYVSLIK